VSAPAASAPTAVAHSQRLVLLIALVAINAVSSIDRVAILTIGPAIKRDLTLSDLEFGLAAGFGFALFYAFLGLPIARLADASSRVRLIAFAVTIWSVCLVLTGFVRNFIQLMICRIAVGIGEAGVQPPSVSLISDLFPPQRRGFGIGILAIGVPVGTLVGAIGGGYLTEFYSWRAALMIIGAVGVLLGILAFTLREPPRVSARPAGAEDVAPSLGSVARHLGRRRSFKHLVLAIGLANITVNGVGAFLPQFFARMSELGPGKIGLVYGAIGAFSTLVSYTFGGTVVDWISRRDGRWYAWLSALGCLLSAPLYVLAFTLSNTILATVLLIFASICVFLYYTPTQVVLQNMAEPRMRATVAFTFFFVVGIVGLGAGPALVGGLSDSFAAARFDAGSYAALCPGGAAPASADAVLMNSCHVASSAGLQFALVCIACIGIWAALHFVLAARTLRADMSLEQ
jgi:predicted MFS family arabinose efflux permease